MDIWNENNLAYTKKIKILIFFFKNRLANTDISILLMTNFTFHDALMITIFTLENPFFPSMIKRIFQSISKLLEIMFKKFKLNGWYKQVERF